ncbi:MAG: TMEM175 family protein [Steroidobacteraceae bacterium]
MSQPGHPAGTERGTERVEAFSDGVFAVAITLLILEVRVPHPPGTTSIDLLKELLRPRPSYLALVLSFVMIGIYWANHHYAFKLFEKTNHSLNRKRGKSPGVELQRSPFFVIPAGAQRRAGIQESGCGPGFRVRGNDAEESARW